MSDLEEYRQQVYDYITANSDVEVNELMLVVAMYTTNEIGPVETFYDIDGHQIHPDIAGRIIVDTYNGFVNVIKH